jgi:hypothetical protein
MMGRVQNLPKLEIIGYVADDQPSRTLSPMAVGLLDEINSRWESTDRGMSANAL